MVLGYRVCIVTIALSQANDKDVMLEVHTTANNDSRSTETGPQVLCAMHGQEEGVCLLSYAWSLIVNLDSSCGRMALPRSVVIASGTPKKMYPASTG